MGCAGKCRQEAVLCVLSVEILNRPKKWEAGPDMRCKLLTTMKRVGKARKQYVLTVSFTHRVGVSCTSLSCGRVGQ